MCASIAAAGRGSQSTRQSPGWPGSGTESKAKPQTLNPGKVCAGAREVRGRRSCAGRMEQGCGRSVSCTCRAQRMFKLPCYLGVCSVSPSAHNASALQLASWGCNSQGLSPEENEGLCCLLSWSCRMTETSAFPSAREVYFQPSFHSASSVP